MVSISIRVVLFQEMSSESLTLKALIPRLAVVHIAITPLRSAGSSSLRHRESPMVLSGSTTSLRKKPSN